MGFCVQKYNIFAKPLLSWAKNITITALETKRRDGRNKASQWLKQWGHLQKRVDSISQ